MTITAKKRLALGITSAITLSMSIGLHAADRDKFKLDISSQSANAALLELGKQAGSEIMFKQGLDMQVILPELKGEYTLDAALDTLLRGTGLTYSLTADGMVVLEQADKKLEDREEKNVEEVVVTGTRLKNSAPTSPVVVITREDMDKQGLVTAADVVRSLPQNFSSINPGSTTVFGNQGIPFAAMGTSSADLRGMGADGTLVLVNGRRMAGSARFDAGQINLETIPSSAIERVEVLLDGASAIYGADAIAGVINFVLKKNYTGAATRVRYENSVNDADSYSLSQTLGYTWNSGSALLALEYRELDGVNPNKAGYPTLDLTRQGGLDYRDTWLLRPNSPANIYGFGALPDTFDGTESWDVTDLIPMDQLPPADKLIDRETATSSKNTSATLSVRQDITGSISAFADVMYSKNEAASQFSNYSALFLPVPASNPYNRLGIPVTVGLSVTGLNLSSTSDSERLNVSAGFDMALPFKNWNLSVTGNYGIEDSAVAGTGISFEDLYLDDKITANENLFGNNVAEVLAPYIVETPHEIQTPERDNRSIELSANGSLFSIAGGDVSLALGTQIREEAIDSLSRSIERNLENTAYFFELSVPLVGADNAMPGVQGMLLSLAGRDEHYQLQGQLDGPTLPPTTKEFGEFTPKVGIRWDITDEFLIRSSWGQSFRAPNLADLYRPVRYRPTSFVQYIDGNGDLQNVFTASGGNSDLKPETSTSFTFGFEWSPEFIDGLTVSATYTEIDWENRIDYIDAGDARLGTINPESLGLILFDVPLGLGGDGDLTTPDVWPSRPVNLAGRELKSIDAYVAYQFDTDFGAFEVDLTVVKTQELSEQLFSFVENQERQGTEFGPDEWVVKAHVGWSRNNYGANLYAKYSSSYDRFKDVWRPPLQDKVDHYITYDLTGFYEMDNGIKFTGGALNLTNQKFPFYDFSGSNYDPRRVDARGRMIYMEVSKEFQF